MKDFYSGPEVAALLGYTRARIWQLTRDGTIDAFQGPGGIWLYPRAVVEALRREGLPNARGVRTAKDD
jgi:hypothetical protein